jgi:3-oxoacyl-[acyl-carrier-protein] synthase II
LELRPHPNGQRRVVVTGLGALTPIGNSVPAFWDALLAGKSGAAPITSFDASSFAIRFACELKGFDPLDHLDRRVVSRMDKYVHYALVATDEALRDAGLRPETFSEEERDCVGVVFGSGEGGMQTFQNQMLDYAGRGPRAISPFFIPAIIPDMAAGLIAMQHSFRGPTYSVSSACATGNHAIAAALSAIQGGEADVVVTGGSEAPICEVGVSAFAAIHALSKRNECPLTASRPFDVTRDGFVMAEGAGALVLESLEHAQARGARIYAEVLSVGASADAYHMTAPHPEGRGAILAMRRALQRAGLAPEDVDTLNMHGTSTPAGDVVESRAVRAVFGAHADRLAATSTKSMTGHMLGAAGAAEAIACVLALVHGVVPPTINVETLDPECDLSFVLNEPVRRPLRVAMSNAFGFGGKNTAAIFRAWE